MRASWLVSISLLGCAREPYAAVPRHEPPPVSMLSAGAITQVALGWDDLCVRFGANGQVVCRKDWALEPAQSSFVAVPLEGAVDLAVGKHHACARLADGDIACWGEREGFAPDRLGVARVPERVLGFRDARELHVADHGTCVRSSDRALWCVGQVGNPKLGDKAFAAPTRMSGVADALGFALGGATLCARLVGGTVWCRAPNGKAGWVPGLDKVLEVASTSTFSCARRTDGSLRCFHPEDATLADKPIAVADLAQDPSLPDVSALHDVVGIAAGEGHVCALRIQGVAACFGENDYGQLGDGTRSGSGVPRAVKRLTGAIGLACGEGRSCALRADGTVSCWGRDLLDDSMFHALTGKRSKPGPPDENDSLVPEALRIPATVPLTRG